MVKRTGLVNLEKTHWFVLTLTEISGIFFTDFVVIGLGLQFYLESH